MAQRYYSKFDVCPQNGFMHCDTRYCQSCNNKDCKDKEKCIKNSYDRNIGYGSLCLPGGTYENFDYETNAGIAAMDKEYPAYKVELRSPYDRKYLQSYDNLAQGANTAFAPQQGSSGLWTANQANRVGKATSENFTSSACELIDANKYPSPNDCAQSGAPSSCQGCRIPQGYLVGSPGTFGLPCPPVSTLCKLMNPPAGDAAGAGAAKNLCDWAKNYYMYTSGCFGTPSSCTNQQAINKFCTPSSI